MSRLILISLLAISIFGQTSHIISGPTPPAKCSPVSGDVFYKTSVSPAQLCTCTTTNTWTCGSPASPVSSVYGRIGSITAQSGDYNTSQIPENTNLYFTNSRAVTALAGLYEFPLSFTSPLSRTTNTISLTTVPVNLGGTGQGTYTKGDLLCASGSSTLIKLPVGTNNDVLTADSAQTCGVKWNTGGGGTPGGIDTYVQVNSAGSFQGYPNMTNDGSALTFNSSNYYPVWGDANNRMAWRLDIHADPWKQNSGVAYADNNGIQITEYLDNGFYIYGNGTNNKTTALTALFGLVSQGAGQTFTAGFSIYKWGVGDVGIQAGDVKCRGNPATGDESSCGVAPFIRVWQDSYLARATILSVSPSTCPSVMTTVGAITGSTTPQTVTVSPNTTGCTDGKWEVVAQDLPGGNTNIDEVKIISHTSNTITGVFANNQASGVTLTHATVLNMDSTYAFGQLMPVINVSATPYTTGTVAWDGNNGFNGTGTSFTASMLRYAISLTPDNVTADPFSVGDPLKDWYQIISVPNSSYVSIYSYSIAGDTTYKGTCRTGCGFTIRPAIRALRFEDNTIIGETSTATWSPGDVLESVIGPFPDASTFQYSLKQYSQGGTYRVFMGATNEGLRTIQQGFSLGSRMGIGGGSSRPWGWSVGYSCGGCIVGFQAGDTLTSAINLLNDDYTLYNTNITWGSAASIGINGNILDPGTFNIRVGTLATSLEFGGIGTAGANGLNQMRWAGMLNIIGPGSTPGQLEIGNSDGAGGYDYIRMTKDSSTGLTFRAVETTFGTDVKLFSISGNAGGPFVPTMGTATAGVNYGSHPYLMEIDQWNGTGHANSQIGGVSLDFLSGSTGAPVQMSLKVPANCVGNFYYGYYSIPLAARQDGVVSIGLNDYNTPCYATQYIADLDPRGLTTRRNFALPDFAGTFAVSGGTQAVQFGSITNTLGAKNKCTHGANATCGVSTLSAGTVTVNTTAIAALAIAGGSGDAVRLTRLNCTSCGNMSIGTVVAGTSFIINSSSGADASDVYWEIVTVN